VKSGFGRNFAQSPFFNETFHGVKLRIFARLEAFRVMQDKPVVAGVTKFNIDVGRSRAIVRDLLLGESISTKIQSGMGAYCQIVFDTKDSVDQ
jgi:hypothetical protein